MNIRQGFVEVEGHRLAYLAVNEHAARPGQPAVVFIHGVLTSLNFWLGTVPPAFHEDRAWYALSLPAHHPSTVPADFDLEQVDAPWFYRLMNGALQQLLEGQKAIVVGHSTGGFCALNLAIHHAPSVVGVVSVAGFHKGSWGSVEGLLVNIAALGRWARAPFAANILVAGRSRFLQKMVASQLAHDSKAYRRSPVSELMLTNTGPNARAQNGTALFHLFNGISRLEIGDQLREIDIPCHVFVGSHDPVVPAAQSARISAEVPGAKTVVFDNTGHMPFMECTEQYFSALESALEDIAQRIN